MSRVSKTQTTCRLPKGYQLLGSFHYGNEGEGGRRAPPAILHYHSLALSGSQRGVGQPWVTPPWTPAAVAIMVRQLLGAGHVLARSICPQMLTAESLAHAYENAENHRGAESKCFSERRCQNAPCSLQGRSSTVEETRGVSPASATKPFMGRGEASLPLLVSTSLTQEEKTVACLQPSILHGVAKVPEGREAEGGD